MSRNSGDTMYAFEGVLPPALLSEVQPGTNLLVSGPSMSGKRQLLLRLLGSGPPDEGAVVVAANDPGDQVAEEYSSIDPDVEFLRVIDCVGSESDPDGPVKSVSSPGDLTGIGIEFSEVAREAGEAGVDRLRIGFDSLSPLLMYVDVQRLFRFLHVFTSQIQSQDWVGLFSIDPDSHEKQVVNTINQLFDGMVEIRLTDEGREARVRGVTDSPTDWISLEESA